MKTVLTVIAWTALAAAAIYVAAILCASICTFVITFVRTSRKKWSGEETEKNPDRAKIHAYGKAWREDHRDCQTTHTVQSGKLRLYGEYYDFGFDRAVIVLLGRSENIDDAFYFVGPYVEAGYNVLTYDTRAHGQSDGILHTFGNRESGDLLVWIRYLRDTLGVRQILLHGMCVGANAAVLLLSSGRCPDIVQGLVCEGMSVRMADNVKKHIIERRKPVYPLIYVIDLWFRIFGHCTMFRGPIDVIDRVTCPILFIYGEEDKYSLPELGKAMYEKCASKQKMLQVFAKGGHSVLRCYNTAAYDDCVRGFIKSLPEV